MSVDEIKQLQQAIGTAAWSLNLDRFAEKFGHDPEHAYTREKFLEFQKLAKAFGAFSAESLARVIGPVPSRIETAATHADFLGG